MLVYGPTGVGKTTISAYVPIVQIHRQNELDKSFVFVVIDGDGGFSYERMEQIAGKDWPAIKDQILYRECVDFGDQHKLLAAGPGGSPSELEKELKSKGLKPALIVFDPFVSAYRGIVNRADQKFKAVTIQQYAAKLDLQLQTMRSMAVRDKFPLIITSWPSSPVGAAMAKEGDTPNETPFIGGRALGFLPKIIVELKSIKFGDGSRLAILFKHRSRLAGTAARFKITEEGVI